MSVADVVRERGTDLDRGLTTEEVKRLREQFGPNALPAPPKPSVIKQILAQFLNPLVGTLLVAAGIAVGVATMGHEPGGPRGLARFSDAIAILTIVILNAFIGFYQERKAEKALDALMKLSAARCKVRRSGEIVHADARQLVPGDLVLLEAGDKVPADLRLVCATELQTVEGELTGESTPVEKQVDAAVPADAGVGDQVTMAFSGTTVVHGEARGVVVATGRETQVGRVGKMLSEVVKQQSPLEERLDQFSAQILWVTLGLSALLFIIGFVKGVVAWHVLLLTAVSVAVAVIPEGLPAITSITLALGMQRMAQRGAVVRKLAAVETLGCATVICTDKTGTLTRNEMTVRSLVVEGLDIEVTGDGGHAAGEFRAAGETMPALPDAAKQAVMAAVLANTASLLRRPGAEVQLTGDPTEGALLVLGEKAGVHREEAMKGRESLLTIPFNSARKRMTVVTRERADGADVVVSRSKGAIDVLLPLCTKCLTAEGVVPLDDARRAAILAKAEAMSAKALRVLAMAERRLGDGAVDRDEAERELTYLGMVGMIDPPRAEVKAAVEAARVAGIRVVMITGDHPITAVAIAKELGLWREGARALTGDDMRAMDDAALGEVLPQVRVFARVDPEHKLRIVQLLQGRHDVVAMTGDGVNDAPAIKQAAIGVAMGRGGTDVAREAADMVLQDDNFATIVEAVREGRAIYRNIQKSIFFLLSSNAGLCIAVFTASFFSPNAVPPLTALQILWINLVTNGLPALALGVDPPESGQMQEAPRAPEAPIMGRNDWIGIMVVGALMAAAAMVIYTLPIWAGSTPHEAERSKLSMVFTLLALSPLAHAFNCRSRTASIFKLGVFSNPLLVVAVVVSGAIHVMALVVPGLQPVFRTDHDWTATEVAVTVGLSLLPVPAIELAKLIGLGRPKAPAAA
ncbi:MAG: cation-translocating P-type ATPase [Deltaproteobacteria bacterium]|nr:cation-translocating P-type ATPase [Myxococcales bacterium]MDP3219957.1 cation-translocating P-type ATPase [Deltaproteobacteria bacterium]